jgi:hypothetical protein
MTNEERVALIEGIQKIGKFWNAVAQDAAVNSIRNLGDNELHVRARDYIARADACEGMAEKVIALIWSMR